MTTTLTAVRTQSDTLSIVAAAFVGLALIFAAGMAHSATLHDVAHDTRHAVGFPCH